MGRNDSPKLITTHLINCRGAERERGLRGGDEISLPVLNAGLEEPVIVRTFNDGRSEPLCRYFEIRGGPEQRASYGTGDKEGVCRAPDEGKFGRCPYFKDKD